MKKSILLILLFISVSLFAQEKVRVMSYNLRNYPNGKDADFKKIIDVIKPDALVVVEMLSQAGVNPFLNNSLSTEYKAASVNIRPTNNAGNDGNDCEFYYKSAVLTLVESKEIPARTRVISKFKLVHNTTKDTLIIFGVHLKANDYNSDNVVNANKRAEAVQSLRTETTNYSSKVNYLICGDFNIFSSTEVAFQKLIDQSSPGYFIDMLNLDGSWSGNSVFSSACTHSTSSLSTRLDMILVSPALLSQGGVDYVNESFKIFGNDNGLHFGTSVNNTTSGSNYWFASDQTLGTSVVNASDHLPVFADFTFSGTSSITEKFLLPTTFELKQNYPNPFNPETILSYQLPSYSHVKLKVYNLLGKEIATLVDEYKAAGYYNSKFSSHNLSEVGSDSQFSSGVYFYQLKVGNFVQTKKMILMK